MPDLVRAQVPGTGRDVTVSRAHAINAGLTILQDQPAVDAFGRPLPETTSAGRRPKPRTTVDEAAAKKTTKKTTARKRAASKSSSGGSTA